MKVKIEPGKVVRLSDGRTTSIKGGTYDLPGAKPPQKRKAEAMNEPTPEAEEA